MSYFHGVQLPLPFSNKGSFSSPELDFSGCIALVVSSSLMVAVSNVHFLAKSRKCDA